MNARKAPHPVPAVILIAATLLVAAPALALPPGGGTGGSERPCGDNGVYLTGQVICDDGRALGGCDVLVETAYGEDYVVGTDENGAYGLCISCPPGQDDVQVVTITPGCCEESVTFEFTGCPEQLSAPPVVCSCGDGPCLPDQTEVAGVVTCEDGTPLAGCEVLVQTVLGGGVMAETDVQGAYSACLPCPPGSGDLQQALITALCCGETTKVDYIGCPLRVEADPILCPCGPSPCPGGEVLVRGQVLRRLEKRHGNLSDRGYEPVPDCEVGLLTSSCGAPWEVLATTDEDGFYERCVPCDPCGDLSEVSVVPRCCEVEERVEEIFTGCPADLSMAPSLCAGKQPHGRR